MKKYLAYFNLNNGQGGAVVIWVDYGSDPDKVFSALYPNVVFLYAEEVE